MTDIALPANLPSVAEPWAAALQQAMFSVCGRDFADKLVGRMSVTEPEIHSGDSATSAIGYALMLKIRGEALDDAARILQALAGAETLAFAALDAATHPGLMPLTFPIAVACAQGVLAGRAPTRDVLQRVAAYALDVFKSPRSRGISHTAFHFRLRNAAVAALLAADLATLRKIVALRPKLSGAPRQWALLRAIASNGVERDIDGTRYLRVEDDDVRAVFLTAFDAHRAPIMTERAAFFDNEFPVMPSPTGNYLYCWIWAQVFAPQPTLAADWSTVRGLMTA